MNKLPNNIPLPHFGIAVADFSSEDDDLVISLKDKTSWFMVSQIRTFELRHHGVTNQTFRAPCWTHSSLLLEAFSSHPLQQVVVVVRLHPEA
jgi:hypothetical protein